MAVTDASGGRLLSSARSGDEVAFMAMVDEAAAPALRLAQGMLGSYEDAEDAFQESVLRAWRALASFRQGASFKTWFLTIVANHCRSQRRNRWRSVLKLPDLISRDHQPRVEDQAVEAATVLQALNRLHSRQRLALILRYYLDLPLMEVAEVLGISETAARARVHRALDRMRTQIDLLEGR